MTTMIPVAKVRTAHHLRCPWCEHALALDLEGVMKVMCRHCKRVFELERRSGVDINAKRIVP